MAALNDKILSASNPIDIDIRVTTVTVYAPQRLPARARIGRLRITLIGPKAGDGSGIATQRFLPTHL